MKDSLILGKVIEFLCAIFRNLATEITACADQMRCHKWVAFDIAKKYNINVSGSGVLDCGTV
jgi:hypothetical protein